MMENKMTFGLNRTGTQVSPIDSAKLKKFTEKSIPDIAGDIRILNEARKRFVQQADNVGSVPLPGSFKGMANTVKDKITGVQLETLIDKLGERLAFERHGVRLYDAFIAKVRAFEDADPELLNTLKHLRAEEAEHFAIVVDAIESLGFDPTAETPCADVMGVAGSGILKVIADPATNLAQCLNAILGAELIDNASWELLIKLATHTNQDDSMIENFEHALSQEKDHLIKIQKYLERQLLDENESAI